MHEAEPTSVGRRNQFDEVTNPMRWLCPCPAFWMAKNTSNSAGPTTVAVMSIFRAGSGRWAEADQRVNQAMALSINMM
jgi:hypothetical protein